MKRNFFTFVITIIISVLTIASAIMFASPEQALAASPVVGSPTPGGSANHTVTQTFTTPNGNQRTYIYTVLNSNNQVEDIQQQLRDGSTVDVAGEGDGASTLYQSQVGRPINDAQQWVHQQENSVNPSSGSATRQTYQPPSQGNQVTCSIVPGRSSFGDCVETVFQWLAYFLLWLSSWILWVAGVVFNYTLGYSLNMRIFLSSLPIVDIGWKIFRDIANISFIFILLTISIATILQIDSYDVKKLLRNVILVAIILNFSLFFTKVIIDSSNILAMQFYSKIITPGQVVTTNNVSDLLNHLDGGLSAAMIKGLGLTTIYKVGGGSGSSGDPTANTGIKGFLNSGVGSVNIIIIGFAGSILILVTAGVFFAGTVLFIIRTVVLVFLMILSPVALVAMTLPATKSYFSKWMKTLLSQAFFAPLYLIMIWIVFDAIGLQTSNSSGGQMDFAALFSGGTNFIGTLYAFIILIAFMLGSLYVAKLLGAYGSDAASGIVGRTSFGVAGWAGRQTVGKAINKVASSDTMDRFRNSNGLGVKRTIAGLADRGAKASFDFRNTDAAKTAGKFTGNLGSGPTGGIKQTLDDEKKRKAEYQKVTNQQAKERELQSAIAKKDEPAIQAALNKFTDNEYKELGGSILTNPLVAKNSRYSQIEAVTDDKNEKLSVTQKTAIRDHRIAELNLALTGKGPKSVKDVLEEMPDSEKANLSKDLISNPKVFVHLGKGIQDDIAKRKDLTPAQIKEVNAARTDALVKAAANPTAAGNDDIIKGVMKGMGGKALFALHNSSGILTNAAVAKYLSVSQLKDLAESGAVKDSNIIGDHIRNDSSAVAHKYIKTGEGRIYWKS
jgi:hypothetical protein